MGLVSLRISHQARKGVVPLIFFGSLTLGFYFCVNADENKKAVIAQGRRCSSCVPLCPKSRLAINASKDFPSVVRYLRFRGCARVRINCAATRNNQANNEQDIPNKKRASANSLSASHMLSFRSFQCGSDVPTQMPQVSARVLWLRGHVQQICCENGFVSLLL